MLDLKPPAPAPHAKTAPTKGWRNYYRVYRVLHLGRFGTVFPGIHGGPSVFPSQDLAEGYARGFLQMLNPPGRFYMDHVAAFPEGEAAN
jgi:hypothetical protein